MEKSSDPLLLNSQERADTSTYLSKCQVDTPEPLVRLVWRLVNARRPNAGEVVDFGCGDARFANAGAYTRYTGYEIDASRIRKPADVRCKIRNKSAFESSPSQSRYLTSIGNPPYVRHHELSAEWLERAHERLGKIDGYRPDGRSNAYVYFMWLAIDSVQDDGLVALVVPYEWVSRPASRHLRKFIEDRGWRVDVYYLPEAGFKRVLTTACITVIDKSATDEGWHLHEISSDGASSRTRSHVTRTAHRRLDYQRAATSIRALRGLSPGGQDAFVLTEAMRIKYRLVEGRDVVPAVTSFRHLDANTKVLDRQTFRDEFINKGRRCWLVNCVGKPSAALQSYLDKVPMEVRETYTCRVRDVWWKYRVPPAAEILYSSGFKGKRPKLVRNSVGAVHVGAVHAIYADKKAQATSLLQHLHSFDFGSKVVPMANGFLKIEVNQMNAVLNSLTRTLST